MAFSPVPFSPQPGGPRERVITYYAPFDKCDREKDYALAWENFS